MLRSSALPCGAAPGAILAPRALYCTATRHGLSRVASRNEAQRHQRPLTHEPLARRALHAPRAKLNTARATTQEPAEDPSLFYEPFLRSFVLGIAMGVVTELIDVTAKSFDLLAGAPNAGDVVRVLPDIGSHIAPLFDAHVAGVACWAALYAIDVWAIYKILEQHSENTDAAVEAMRKAKTLPKILLPRMNLVKSLARLIYPFSSQQAAFVTAAPGTSRSGGVIFTPPKPGEPVLDPRQEPEGPTADQPAVLPRERRQKKRAGLKPGEADVGSRRFADRISYLQRAKDVLYDMWYPVCECSLVTKDPRQVQMLGKSLVVYRAADGSVACLDDTCPHRGAPMHMGWTKEVGGQRCLVCKYHGWEFGEDGELLEVPAAAGKEPLPRNSNLASYHVREQGGYVWLFYGDDCKREQTPIPYIPELEDPSWKAVRGEIEFEANHAGVFDNAIDVSHIHYLHTDSFGNEDKPQIREMHTTDSEYQVAATFKLHNKPVNALWEFSKVPEVEVELEAHLPSTSKIKFKLGHGVGFITVVHTVPISPTRSVNRFTLVRRLQKKGILSWLFNHDALDGAWRKAMIQILTQDKAMVEKLRPEELQHEVSVRADLPQQAFRNMRDRYYKKHNRVGPTDALNSPFGDM